MPAPLSHVHSRMATVLTECSRYARSRWPVLIRGETGVGKEVLARRLHAQSPRARGPFVPVNCTSLPATLFESELFGHEKGAFSGASQYFRGLFRSASGGTLFLDEIGDLDRSLQVKLLRVLETGEVRAIGSAREDRLDVRFVAATNVDLLEGVRSGVFRHDLYQRLSVLYLDIPPLRKRLADLPDLVRQICEEIGAMDRLASYAPLLDYHWPGNIRQLKNILIRASVLSEGELRDGVLDEILRAERLRSPEDCPSDPLHGTLAEIERRVILGALKRCHGSRKQAAKELGIAKSTLHEKLRRWREEGSPCWPVVRATPMVAEHRGGTPPGLDF
ncbi:MAG: sigma-54-dependent Fis family transcriptional regulator [Bdellovibrionales bacterium]|nr:sigma-54-dependent Fis family transcriptional regulator [Bdellovibrionales bacterium]